MCCSEDTTSRPDGLNNALRPFEELWVPELFAVSVRSARGEPDASDFERWMFPCLLREYAGWVILSLWSIAPFVELILY